MLAQLTETLTTFITNLYIATGLFGIILAMAIESCCIPLPSEIVMPIAGALIASRVALPGTTTNPILSLFLVALAGAFGCLIGSMAAYGIGYSGGRPLMLKYGRYLLISHHDADKADQFFQRWGNATAFFSRLLPVVRTYISLPAGISKMPFVKFCIYSFLGSFPWCLLLAFVGYVLGNNSATLSPIFHSLDVVILIALIILVVLYVRRHLRNDKLSREAAVAATNSHNIAHPNVPNAQQWNQQSVPQNQYHQASQQGTQGQEWNQQPFPQQQNWPSAPDDRTIRR